MPKSNIKEVTVDPKNIEAKTNEIVGSVVNSVEQQIAPIKQKVLKGKENED